MIISGKEISTKIKDQLKEEVEQMKNKYDLNTHNLQETVFLIFVCSFYCLFKRVPLKMYLWHTCVLWVFKKYDRLSKLAVILVGENQASQVYVRNKERGCSYVGMDSLKITHDATFSEEELLNEIKQLNEDETVDGIFSTITFTRSY